MKKYICIFSVLSLVLVSFCGCFFNNNAKVEEANRQGAINVTTICSAAVLALYTVKPTSEEELAGSVTDDLRNQFLDFVKNELSGEYGEKYNDLTLENFVLSGQTIKECRVVQVNYKGYIYDADMDKAYKGSIAEENQVVIPR